MVTLRRDIAAAQPSRFFSQNDNASENNLTGYDLFMQEKRNFERKSSSFFTQNSGVQEETLLNNSAEKKQYGDLDFDTYEEYMNIQLHRKNPGRLLSEEEFYGKKQAIANVPKIRKNVASNSKINAAKKLTKQGKIFVAIYLIVVAAIACIILSVNTQRNNVMANASDQSELVTPMAIEVEDHSNKDNAFDKILDRFTNK